MMKVHGKARITIDGVPIDPFDGIVRDVLYTYQRDWLGGVCAKAKIRSNPSNDVFYFETEPCTFKRGHEGRCSWDCIDTTARDKTEALALPPGDDDR